jgi:RNA polymerase subunit RPABC4/transcription elongation factor Spt4
MLVCRDCGTRADLDTLSECPVCGSTRLTVAEPEQVNQGFNLAFGIFGCEDCGAFYSLDQDRSICPRCGSIHDLPDRRVEDRVQAFGSDLIRLQERLEFAHNEIFSDRGARRPDPEYLTWLRSSVIEQFENWAEDLISGMSRGNFSEPNDPQTTAAWANLQRITNELIDFVLALKREPSPV